MGDVNHFSFWQRGPIFVRNIPTIRESNEAGVIDNYFGLESLKIFEFILGALSRIGTPKFLLRRIFTLFLRLFARVPLFIKQCAQRLVDRVLVAHQQTWFF